MSLLSKTDYVQDGTFYDTHLEVASGFTGYNIRQSTGGAGPISKDEEVVLLNRQQAVIIARTILRNEGFLID